MYVDHLLELSGVCVCWFVCLLELQKDFTKEEQLKFKDGSSKLLSGNKFQDKYFVLRDKKLLLYKDTKV